MQNRLHFLSDLLVIIISIKAGCKENLQSEFSSVQCVFLTKYKLASRLLLLLYFHTLKAIL